MNILIADDEIVILEGLKRTITNRFPDHRTYLAVNAEEAVTVLRTQRIELALTDIRMPGMSGLDLMRLTRSQYPHIRWVVISAYSEFSYAQEAVRLGAKDYLLKPIGKEAVIRLVEQLEEEIAREQALIAEEEQLNMSRNYVREAVFQRWSSGLDIGCFDMAPLMESYPHFHLVLVRMDTGKTAQLEHFMVENVMSELIDRYGSGFVTIHSSKSLLGLVSLKTKPLLLELIEELRKYLVKMLRVPFQILHTDRIEDVHRVPGEVQHMFQSSSSQVYENIAGSGNQLIEVAQQYIRTHLKDDLSLEKVASVVYLNPAYLSQLFKQTTGEGFKEYVIRLRLEHAKQLLLNPKLKLAEIAEKSGYHDLRHFSRLFRKKFGQTPTEYRSASQ